MKPIINHHYSVLYHPTYDFTFDWKNDIVHYDTYESKILSRLKDIAINLVRNPNSRQEVIVINTPDDNSCLISVQILAIDNILTLIANYRSQDINLGQPYDEDLLRYIATYFMDMFEYTDCKILCNVAVYHERTLENPTGY